MNSNKVILLCSACDFKKVCALEETGLVELKNDSMSSRKFRCPWCGRAVAPRKFPDPQADLENKAKEERLKVDHEAFVGESIEFQRKFSEESNG